MTDAPRMHGLTLRFRDAAWERAFDDHHYATSLPWVRVAFALGFAITSLWLAWAVLLRPELLTNPASNYAVPLVLLAGLVATFAPGFRRWMRPLLVAVGLTVPTLIVVNYALTPNEPGAEVAAAVSLTIGVVYQLLFSRLRFDWAVPTVLVIFTASLAIANGLGMLRQPVAYVTLGSFLVIAAVAGYLTERQARREFVAQRLLAEEQRRLNEALTELAAEREKSDRLLLNVLPAPIAARLKAGEEPIADGYDDVSVLFADIVDFTGLSARCTPDQMVGTLNDVFSAFDRLAAERGLEKIKTVGDAYMVVGGLPERRPDHAEAIAEMALDMRGALRAKVGPTGEPLRVRIGINTGQAVAGVIGTAKFAYDLWGDAVNTASRMESHGVPDQIQVTQAVRDRLGDRFAFEPRGVVDVKGKGPMPVYLLLDRLAAAPAPATAATVQPGPR